MLQDDDRFILRMWRLMLQRNGARTTMVTVNVHPVVLHGVLIVGGLKHERVVSSKSLAHTGRASTQFRSHCPSLSCFDPRCPMPSAVVTGRVLDVWILRCYPRNNDADLCALDHNWRRDHQDRGDELEKMSKASEAKSLRPRGGGSLSPPSKRRVCASPG